MQRMSFNFTYVFGLQVVFFVFLYSLIYFLYRFKFQSVFFIYFCFTNLCLADVYLFTFCFEELVVVVQEGGRIGRKRDFGFFMDISFYLVVSRFRFDLNFCLLFVEISGFLFYRGRWLYLFFGFFGIFDLRFVQGNVS